MPNPSCLIIFATLETTNLYKIIPNFSEFPIRNAFKNRNKDDISVVLFRAYISTISQRMLFKFGILYLLTMLYKPYDTKNQNKNQK